MGQAFMVIGDMCQMGVQCAGSHSPVSYMVQLLEFSMQQQDRLFHFLNACLDHSMIIEGSPMYVFTSKTFQN